MKATIEGTLDALQAGRITRREAVLHLGAVVLALAGASRTAAVTADASSPTFGAVGLNHLALRVTDVARSRDFYLEHLGLKVVSESDTNCFLGCGKNFVALFRSDSPGMDHYCYTVPDYSAGDVVERLKSADLNPERHADRVYFDDPDGLTVQLAGNDHWPA
jgi:metallothiol transferase